MNSLEMFEVDYLPLDDRPCNIDFPHWLSKAAGFKLLTASSPGEFSQHLEKSPSVLVSYDRWIYGGLLESREKKISLEQAKSKLQKLEKLLSKKNKKRYGFNVLLRQAPSAFNVEEERLAALIKQASMLDGDKVKQRAILAELPKNAWNDYCFIRNRNFEINKKTIDFAKKKALDCFVIGLDDLTSIGLNQKERKALEGLIRQKKASSTVRILPGADELGMLLLARMALDQAKKHPRIFPVYSHPTSERFRLRYEDCSVQVLFKQQAELLKAKIVNREKDADLLLFIHTPHEDQLDVPANPAPVDLELWLDRLEKNVNAGKLCVLADLRYANGADSHLMRSLPQRLPFFSLAGFSAWNTSANALGVAFAQGAVRWVADATGTFTKEKRQAHEALLALRVYEDWFYQAEIRPGIIQRFKKENRSRFSLRGEEESQLSAEVKNKIQRALQLYFKADFERFPDFTVSFPWHRLFDIRFELRGAN